MFVEAKGITHAQTEGHVRRPTRTNYILSFASIPRSAFIVDWLVNRSVEAAARQA